VDFTTLIDVESLRALMASPGVAVLDCRFDLAAPDAGRQAYLRSHIPGARYVDLNRDLSAPVSAASGRHPLPDPVALDAFFHGLRVVRNSQVVVYDESNGSFAARAWWLLRWLGFSKVAVLDGGMSAWLRAGGATESGEPSRAAAEPAGSGAAGSTGGSAVGNTVGSPGGSLAMGSHRVQVDRGAALGADELIAALENPRTLLIDARAPERYAGAVEPIDPVAGHVPGAVNHPFSANLQSDGRFLPPEELERRWRDRLGDASPADVIVMCGSGVTACHNLLALERCGLPGARLYAGSWSEWIRDPRRPVARG
jgi:thiosulfate/3-mercaptopyruvate sulfurtransferase